MLSETAFNNNQKEIGLILKPKYLVRCFVLIVAEIEMIFYSGIMFGLNSLLPILKENGFFHNQFNRTYDNANATSTKQNETFGYILITGIASCHLFSFPLGLVMDRYGIKTTKLISASSLLFGCLLFSSCFLIRDILIFPAFVLLGIFAQSICICNFPLAILVPKFQNIIISIFSGSFSSSAMMLTFVLYAYQRGIDVSTSILTIGISGFILMICSRKFLLDKVDRIKAKEILVTLNGESDNRIRNCKSDSYLMTSIMKQENYKNSQFPRMKTILRNHYFLFQLFFMVITFFRFSFFLAQLSVQMEKNFSDDETKAKSILLVGNYFFIPSVVISPIVGLMIDYQKNRVSPSKDQEAFYKSILKCFGIPMLICSLANLSMSILIIIPNEVAMYMAYLACTVTRCFMFSLNASYIISAFPRKYFGKLFGLNITICGCVSFLQYILLLNNICNLNVVNFILIAFSILSFIHPVILLLN
uniref:Slc43a-1 n=1 Tax=Schmidtea mediterranea TaxID=79327 RepID=A0A0H3YKI8_SCHMD|nr:slc43a-1 [Schmidtea mediterranea]